MKVKQKKSALLPGLITALMVVAAVAGGLRMTDPDGGRLDTMRQELETITILLQFTTEINLFLFMLPKIW